MKRAVIWFLMLWKRLLKKPGFLILLAVIPLLSLSLRLSSADGGGFVNIALALEGEADEVALNFVCRLEEESEIFLLTHCQSTEEAKGLVEAGKADTAWIIEGDLGRQIEENAGSSALRLATVYQREDNVFLKMAREKIYCTLYPHIAYDLYRDYTAESFPAGEELSEEEIYDAFMIYAENEKLIDLVYTDGGVYEEDTNYLTAPLRGLLPIILLMCTMASTLYYLADEERGTFTLVAPNRRIYILLGSNLSASLTAALFITLSLIMSQNYTDPISESLSMLLLLLSCTAFSSFLGSLIHSVRYFVLTIPVILVFSIVFCPVFINLQQAELLQRLLPISDYLYSVHDSGRLLNLLVYTVIAIILCKAVFVIRNRRIKL